MNQTLSVTRSAPRARGLVAVAVLVLAACGGTPPAKSDSALAAEALAAGIAAHKSGDITTAAKDYYLVLTYDQGNKFAFYNLGVIAQGNNRLMAAEGFYRLVLQLDPAYPSALYNLAIIREGGSSGDTEALDLYRAAAVGDPNNASYHLHLGTLLLKLGQVEAGQVEINEALRLDPTLIAPIVSPAPSVNVPTPSEVAPTASPSGAP
jgi:Flp pilus assembly protein TadD